MAAKESTTEDSRELSVTPQGPLIALHAVRRKISELVSTDNNTPKARRAEVAVVCLHPWGALGGNAENNVVLTLYARFHALGFAVARFDFRGGGSSTGSRTWTGSGEVEDLRAVCRHLLSETPTGTVPIKNIVLLGYSYGSAIAGALVDELPEVLAYAAIAYPFSVLWAITCWNHRFFLDKLRSSKPKLFLLGKQDNFTSVSSFESYIEHLPKPVDKVILDNCDHFFWSRERAMADAVQNWMLNTLFL